MSAQAMSNPTTTDLYRTDDLERAARVARYKEQRRRQLDSQFHDVSSSASSSPTRTVTTHTTTSNSNLRRRYISRTRNLPVVGVSGKSSRGACCKTGGGDDDNNGFQHQSGNLTNGSSSVIVTTSSRSEHNNSSPTSSANSTMVTSTSNIGGIVRTTRTSRLRSGGTSSSNTINTTQQTTINSTTITSSPHKQQFIVISTSGEESSSTTTGAGGDGGDRLLAVEKNSLTNSRIPLQQASSNDVTNPILSSKITTVTSPKRKVSSPRTPSSSLSTSTSTGLTIDKDKSSKRKSNLNRSLNTEEVPSPYDNLVVNQRRRHLAPITVPMNSSTTSILPSTNNYKLIDSTQKSQQRKPSQLSIHMENARRSISNNPKENVKRPSVTITASSPRSKLNTQKSSEDLSSSTNNISDRENQRKSYRRNSQNDTTLKRKVNSSLNKKPVKSSENLIKNTKRPSSAFSTLNSRRSSSDTTNSSTTISSLISPRKLKSPSPSKENSQYSKINEISRRMDSLTHLTRSTIARVERLATTRANKGGSGDLNETHVKRNKDLTKLDNNSTEKNFQVVSDISNNLDKLENGAQKPNVPDCSQNRITHGEQQTATPSTSNSNDFDKIYIIEMASSILKKKSINDKTMESILPEISNELSSILKNTTTIKDEQHSSPSREPQQQYQYLPVSILKRKTSQDESSNTCHHHNMNESSHSPSAPVTFSPSVVDPPTASRRRQSILKKRRSLDESEVLRRRSCSPDVTIIEGTTSDFRPILKQRRSSLEEIRIGSPEPQGILKRKTSRGSDENYYAEDRSVIESPEPQSILKRKSGSSSSGSNGSQQHVSIATAVILAAAGGAEIICGDMNENVRPILKKKSISSDESPNIIEMNETVPKPILKKKYSTDTDDYEERPKKPILKMSRTQDSQEYSDTETTSSQSKWTLRTRSSESSSSFETGSPVRKLSNRTSNPSDSNDELVSILKQSCSRESSPRPRLSFCEELTGDDNNGVNSESCDTSPTINEFAFLRRPSMSPIYRSRSSGSDYDERYRKRRTIHLGEGEKFLDDSNIRLRRQSMSDMADTGLSSHLNSQNGGGSSCSMSVAERIMRMESFLAQEQKNSKVSSNTSNNNNNNNHVVTRRKSSLRSTIDIAADPQRFTNNYQHQIINSRQQETTTPSKSSSMSGLGSSGSSKNFNTNGSQGILEPSQICLQNGGETISNSSLLQNEHQQPSTSSTVTIQSQQQEHELQQSQESSTSGAEAAAVIQQSSQRFSTTIVGNDTSSSTQQSIELMSVELTTISGSSDQSLHDEGVPSLTPLMNSLHQNHSSSDSGCVLIKESPIIKMTSNSLLSNTELQVSNTNIGDSLPPARQQCFIKNDHHHHIITTPSLASNLETTSGGDNLSTSSRRSAALQQQQQENNMEMMIPPERRNSVSSRAAAFNKQAEEQKRAANGENCVKKKSVNAGIERFKHRKALRNNPSEHSRFSTQPVTYGEIQEAAKQNQTGGAQQNREDEFDPSKLTLAERVKLFNEKMSEEIRIKTVNTGPPPMRKRYSRFKTQPITTDEVQSAQQKINPLIASFVKPPSSEELDGLNMKQTKDKINQHAVRMLTNEVKGILKSKSFISPINNNNNHTTTTTTSSNSTDTKKNVVATNKINSTNNIIGDQQQSQQNNLMPSIKTIYKDQQVVAATQHESSDIKKSECYDHLLITTTSSSSSSEGESSGGREIKSIIQNDPTATSALVTAAAPPHNRSTAAESQPCGDKKFLHKSKSQSSCLTNDIKNVLNNENAKKIEKTVASTNEESESNLILSIKHVSSTNHTDNNDTDKSDNSCCDDDNDNILVQLQHQNIGNVETEEDERQSIVTSPLSSKNNNICIHRSRTTNDMPASADDVPDNISPSVSIAERRAALQHAGNNDWKRRLVPINKFTEGELKNIVVTTNNIVNESTKLEEKTTEIITTSSVLADRVCKLETASQGWKKRVEQSDAINFTVAGRMRDNVIPVSPSLPNIPASGNKTKKTPKPARFKTKQERLEANGKDSDVTLTLTRSISVPNSGNGDIDIQNASRVSVPRADDETFTSFFTSFYEQNTSTTSSEYLELTSEDLDVITRTSNDKLLGHKRAVKIQRKHLSKNPIKSLNARTDICSEYTEIKTGIAEKELTRIKAEKFAKNSNMAIAALAGLASKEDFTAINLKKTNTANSITFSMLPYNDLMLIHIKGRRHVQARLVEPVVSSINRGDNYVLLTKNQVYNYQGLFSNIIEQSRAAEIANASALSGNKQIIIIHEEKNTCNSKHVEEFWKLLGHTDDESPPSITDAGHPDEDEIYESKIIETNMVYELENEELIPYTQYWGCIPKIDMLDPYKILVFDFGTELYVWNGKNSSLDRRKVAVKLAKELWQEGYDYTDCDICPINATQMLGTNRTTKTINNDEMMINNIKSKARPNWALLAKITQNMEPILFREKFLDWPDYSRVIKVKEDQTDKSLNIIIKPLDVTQMLQSNTNTTPDLILEGSHLGRGTKYYDEETNRYFEISTTSVQKWHIQEFEYFELGSEELNHFYSGDSYIIRWQYMVTVTGRELSGKPSRHSLAGRDRCAYFCWQGKDASLNEKGAAALLTVELDYERGPQVRVTEGFEPPAFLNLFKGGMIIHSGKMEDLYDRNPWRLYFCRGDVENETFLTEVPCNMRQLRSRASMIFINLERIILWHGAKSLEHTRKMAQSAAERLKLSKSEGLQFKETPRIDEVDEGNETPELLNVLGASQGRQLYVSLLKDPCDYMDTPRLFCFSSTSGVFEANEVLCPHRTDEPRNVVTAYPFLQSELYSASQPTIFLFDNGNTLWLWQGWWPEIVSDTTERDHSPPSSLSDQTGSGAIRWQEERRAAMQTTINYWREKYGKRNVEEHHDKKENEKCPAVLVWAGLEPLEFTNLFPTWMNRDDIAEINIRDGRKPGEMLSLNSELERLTCCTYPAAVLLQRPLPDGVDPTRLEEYLSPNHFTKMFNGLTKEQFYDLPTWRQTNLKKQLGLF